MRRWIDCRALIALLAVATVGNAIPAHAAEPIAVEVINASEPTLCAEKDNVYVQLRSAEVRQFTVVAEHPAYAGTIVADRSAPDFRNCDMSSDPVHTSESLICAVSVAADPRITSERTI